MESVKLDCRGLWKLYGTKVSGLLNQTTGKVNEQLIPHADVIRAVCDVDVQIQEGEIFVIMGLSGSGKSTLVRCLSRLIEPSAGQVNFEGRDLLSMSESELIQLRRQKMGMVFQHFALLPHLTVLQNVTFPLEIQGISASVREQKASEIISIVGLEGREENYPRELSGGQQQRVGIARSLVTKPDLWFLDEPFSALDPLIRREMQDEFLRLQSMLKKTIIFITHDFDEAIRLADRIAVMKDGRIVQTATPEHLTLYPATPYVEEFTKYILHSKVVKLRTIATPLETSEAVAGKLSQNLTVSDSVEQITSSDLPYHVVDDSGNPIGIVDQKAVINVMLGRSK